MAVIVVSGPLLQRKCIRSATVCQVAHGPWPDTISQAAAFLCGVAFFRAKFDAGRSMLFVQL